MAPYNHYVLDEYDYTSIFDMYQFANRIERLPDDKFERIAPHIMGAGLMRTNRIIMWAIKFIMWRHRHLPEPVAWVILNSRMLKYDVHIFSGLKAGVIRHMTVGEDKSDIRSAAGFNKQEIETLAVLVNTAEAL